MCGYCGLELESEPQPVAAKASYRISLSTILVPLVLVFVIGGVLRGRKEPKVAPPAQNAPSAPEEPLVEDESPDEGSSRVKSAEARIPDAFIITGQVFDVLTAKPVNRPTVIFHNPNTNERLGAFADDQGRYKAWLKAVTGGYIVTIQHANYHEVYTVDWTPSIRTLPEMTRRIAMRDLLVSPPKPLELYGLPNEKHQRDFVLVPTR